jgi:hypothetical protein
MVLLQMKLREKTVIVNLGKVEMIEFEPASFDLWIKGKPFCTRLKEGSAKETQARFLAALLPIYEGRMNNVMGIKIDLDLSDLQPNEETPF